MWLEDLEVKIVLAVSYFSGYLVLHLTDLLYIGRLLLHAGMRFDFVTTIIKLNFLSCMTGVCGSRAAIFIYLFSFLFAVLLRTKEYSTYVTANTIIVKWNRVVETHNDPQVAEDLHTCGRRKSQHHSDRIGLRAPWPLSLCGTLITSATVWIDIKSKLFKLLCCSVLAIASIISFGVKKKKQNSTIPL